jgi:hypothetical protein
MARTTPEDVGTVITLPVGVDVNAYIDSAAIIVNAVCLDSEYTGTTLEMIERWLAAHFIAVNYPRNARLAIGGGPQLQREPGKWDLGLNFTKYGQQAMRIDYKGNLAALEQEMLKGKARTAETKWVGFSSCNP